MLSPFPNKILALGCSHVAGCELVEYSQGQDIDTYDDLCRLRAFPQQIADRLGIACENWARSGGSNARSLRILAREITAEPTVIIFGYTYMDRREFWWPDSGSWPARDRDQYLQVGSQWADLPWADCEANRSYVRDLWRPVDDLAYVHSVVRALGSGHRIIHLKMSDDSAYTHPDFWAFEGQDNYQQWLDHRGFARGPLGHGLEAAHSELAELILKDLGIE